jgi:hypothetical protein
MIVSDFGTRSFLFEVQRTLSPYGSTSEQFVSGSLGSPFWVNSLPDLIFVPHTGPHAGVPHIVEVKRSSTGLVPDIVLNQAANQASKIVAANGGRVRVALMLNSALSPAQLAHLPLLRVADLTILDGVGNSLSAAQRILEWARVVGR